MPFFGKATRRNDHTNNHSTVQHLYETSSPPHCQPYPQQQFHHCVYPDTHPYANPAAARTALTVTQPQPSDRYSGWSAQTTEATPKIVHQGAVWRQQSPPQYTGGHQGLYDYVGDRFCDVVSCVDEDAYPSGEQELVISYDQPLSYGLSPALKTTTKGAHYDFDPAKNLTTVRRTRGLPHQAAKCTPTRINVLSKVSLYANSRLPADLPPLRLYIPSWPLICLAADYSNDAYKKPTACEKRTYVNADVRLGTKAMVVKSVPIDDAGLIVFAIRGTSLLSLRDWNVNMSTTPVSPAGLLEDPGNLCHEGFLKVARAMIIPIAARLRQLLQENPSRSACSLLITGHSAGGAVASLLYSHMLSDSQDCQSELSILTGCFKRVHCITFGAPPVTLLPLWKPPHSERRLQKSLFLSFINEGDVVCRAERAYIRSLVELLTSPSPVAVQAAIRTAAFRSVLDLSKKPLSAGKTKTRAIWKTPPATLSNAGRLVLLRADTAKKNASREKDVSACIVTDEQLRGVVFGDPFIHTMEMYARRVKVLATKAVMGG